MKFTLYIVIMNVTNVYGTCIHICNHIFENTNIILENSEYYYKKLSDKLDLMHNTVNILIAFPPPPNNPPSLPPPPLPPVPPQNPLSPLYPPPELPPPYPPPELPPPYLQLNFYNILYLDHLFTLENIIIFFLILIIIYSINDILDCLKKKKIININTNMNKHDMI